MRVRLSYISIITLTPSRPTATSRTPVPRYKKNPSCLSCIRAKHHRNRSITCRSDANAHITPPKHKIDPTSPFYVHRVPKAAGAKAAAELAVIRASRTFMVTFDVSIDGNNSNNNKSNNNSTTFLHRTSDRELKQKDRGS